MKRPRPATPTPCACWGPCTYNGLNVPQNTKEGIRWYRKAAAAGSVAAKKDLEQLGLTPEE